MKLVQISNKLVTRHEYYLLANIFYFYVFNYVTVKVSNHVRCYTQLQRLYDTYIT